MDSLQTTNAADRFQHLDHRVDQGEYNFEHFRTTVLLRDAQRTIEKHGIMPGEIAPDFELPSGGGGSLRLSSLRGKPVLLDFGSYS